MKHALLILFLVAGISCSTTKAPVTNVAGSNGELFWSELQKLCGQAYEGQVVAAPDNDTVFKNKRLVMHVRACDDNTIRIPFMVGDDRSRTWVLSRVKNNLQLKHDHRHADGTADTITQYGGLTTNAGLAQMQVFPADAYTTGLLPAAAGNVWWITLKPGEYFTYNLRRIGTDRLFTIAFNLKQTIQAPAAPWGWKD